MTNVLFNTTISDMEVGYKAFRGDLVRSLDLVSDDFAIEPELAAPEGTLQTIGSHRELKCKKTNGYFQRRLMCPCGELLQRRAQKNGPGCAAHRLTLRSAWRHQSPPMPKRGRGGFFRPLSLDRKNLGYLPNSLAREHKVGNPVDVKLAI